MEDVLNSPARRPGSDDDEICDVVRLPPEPQVSVLVVTYNHAAFVEQAIRSVVGQDAPVPFEIIIGDDLSSDATPEILRALQGEFPSHIRLVLRARNVGANDNIRDLAFRARGQFLAFCEGDDFWMRADKLLRQLELMAEKPRPALIFSDYGRAFLTVDGWRLLPSTVDRNYWQNRTITTIDLLASMPIHLSVAFAAADLVREYLSSSFYQPALPLGDVPMFLYLSTKGDVRFLPETFAVYRHHGQSITNITRDSRFRVVRAHAQVVELFADHIPTGALRRAVARANRKRMADAAYVAGKLTTFLLSMNGLDVRDWARALFLLAPPLHKARLKSEEARLAKAFIQASAPLSPGCTA